MAEITNNIQLNKKLLQDQKEELQKHQGSYDDLVAKAKLKEVVIEDTPLGYPRTVCTAPKCVDVVSIGNLQTEVKRTIYKTHCHKHCGLTNVQKDKVPEPALLGCTAMGGTQSCIGCRCPWNVHMHIYYEQKQNSNVSEMQAVQDAIKKNQGEKAVKEAAVKSCEDRLKQHENEHQTIISSAAKFGAFLKANAIKPYNDAIEEYLNYSIKEEERLIAAGKTNKIKLDSYKQNLVIYQQQKAILDQALTQGSTKIDPQDVTKLVEDLKSLPLNGKTFKKLFELTVIGENKNFAFTENYYDPATGQFISSRDGASNSSILDSLKNIRIFSKKVIF